jgi:hypothetical protein
MSYNINQKEFPTYDEFYTWYKLEQPGASSIWDYFADRVRTVMPEVGQEYEGLRASADEWVKGTLNFIAIDGYSCRAIRPITTPTRDEVIAKCRALGLTEEELEVLK